MSAVLIFLRASIWSNLAPQSVSPPRDFAAFSRLLSFRKRLKSGAFPPPRSASSSPAHEEPPPPPRNDGARPRLLPPPLPPPLLLLPPPPPRPCPRICITISSVPACVGSCCCRPCARAPRAGHNHAAPSEQAPSEPSGGSRRETGCNSGANPCTPLKCPRLTSANESTAKSPPVHSPAVPSTARRCRPRVARIAIGFQRNGGRT